jgi:hypothetical protein
MRFQVSDPAKTEQLALVFMLTAYERCGSELGMGVFQTVNNNMDGVTIRKHITGRSKGNTWMSFYGDYVAGRMVKTGISFEPTLGLVEISDDVPRPDYQGWSSGIPTDPGALLGWTPSAGKLNSFKDLLMTAAQTVECHLTEVVEVLT